jgi:DNA-damage-inducible protein J
VGIFNIRAFRWSDSWTEKPLLGYTVAQAKEAHFMNTVVRARIDEKVKDDASVVLASIGLTVSDAFRLMMMRIATEKRLPFEPLVPNAETVAAMEAARRGDVRKFGSVSELMADLNADD